MRIDNRAITSSAAPFRCDAATIAHVLTWYQDNHPDYGKGGSRERTRLFNLLSGAYGAQLCRDCRPFHLLAFINEQQADGAPETRRRWNSTLQVPFNSAFKLGLIDKNPFKGLSFPPGKEGRDWTDSEYQCLLRHAKPWLRRFIIFIRYSGMRPGEIRALEWAQIKDATGVIVQEEHKTADKTGEPRVIYLNEVTIKMLMWLSDHRPKGSKHVFLNSHGKPWSCKAITKAIAAIRVKAGLADDVKMHGGRHYFATRAIINGGVDIATLAKLLGHKKVSTTQRYTHLAGKFDHLGEAAQQAVRSPRRK